jgi:FtsZ-binding cell division protein ZapB
MGLFDKIDRLLYEHTSAAISKEYITLLNAELSILKEKFAVLAAENEALKTENENLKLQRDDCQKKLREHEDLDIGFFPNMVIPPEGIK